MFSYNNCYNKPIVTTVQSTPHSTSCGLPTPCLPYPVNNTQTATIQQTDHQPHGAIHAGLTQPALQFALATQQPLWGLSLNNVIQPRQLGFQHPFYKTTTHFLPGLVHLPTHYTPQQGVLKIPPPLPPHLFWVRLAMMQNIAFNPI